MKMPKKQTLGLIGTGLALYLIFLAVLFPASLAWSLTQERATPLQLASLQGSIWSGSAGHVRYSNEMLGKLEWRLSPWSLLRGQPGAWISLNRNGETLEGHITMDSDNTLSASDLSLSIHGESLRSWTTPYLLHGEIQANLSALHYQPGKRVQAEGRLSFDNAEIEGPQSLILGRIDASISPEAEGSVLKFENNDSPLDMKGNIRLNGNGSYRVTAGVLNRDNQRRDINEALKIFGKPDATGRIQLSYYGKLRLR